MQIDQEDIGKALTGMLHSIDAEYAEMSQAELESKWRFKFDPKKPLEWNMYDFHDRLALFSGSCRRWEEMHNGRRSVVERVRDKYIMPRLREFAEIVRQHNLDNGPNQ